LAFTKEQKTEIMNGYENWVDKSEAIYVLSYKNMNMKAIDGVRAKIRESGGEIHVVKNTLFQLVLEKKKLSYPKELLEKSNIIAFAFSDPPAMAKLLSEATRNSDIFQIKGGYLANQPVSMEQIKALADLPPLPVLRATLLGVLQGPSSKLARTLAEPARSLASIFKAYSEKEAAVPA
jgi:large subunit ribosomal protein L10